MWNQTHAHGIISPKQKTSVRQTHESTFTSDFKIREKRKSINEDQLARDIYIYIYISLLAARSCMVLTPVGDRSVSAAINSAGMNIFAQKERRQTYTLKYQQRMKP